MRRIPHHILQQMGHGLSEQQRDEMAIPSYLHPNPLLRFMAWHRVEVVADLLEASLKSSGCAEDLAIMDYGCGTGILLSECCRLAQRVYGVDPVLNAAQMLVQKWDLQGVTLIHPEQIEDEVNPKSLDRIVAAEVLEHIQPLDGTLSLFRDRLKKDGKLLVSLPTENALYRLGRRLAGFSGDYHHSNAKEVHREIERCGFVKRAIRSIPIGGPFSIYWVILYDLGNLHHE